MKKVLLAVTGLALATALAGCGGGESGDSGTIGILMPSTTNARWQIEADQMTATFKERGYDTSVQYANDDAPTQVSQLEDMVTKGVKALVVVAVDGKALGGPLADAKASNIPVVAYTRLLQQTDAVDFYTTFDYKKYGALSGTAILQGLGIQDADGKDTGKTGPFNIEIVNGSPIDSVAHDMWEGYRSTLQPYLDRGTLRVLSGQDTFDQSATLNWNPETAQKRMENIITKTYSGGAKLDAVWVPYDGLTRGVISALTSSGFSPGTDRWPLLTGGDAEVDSVKAILAGQQYSTVYLDYKTLAKGTAELVADQLDGKGFPAGDTEYDNGTTKVRTKLFDLSLVRDDDVKPVLVDRGFYTADQVGLK
ncbi:sugar ABC transporter substrate-binding protein [Amycolatopsis deserti]|uniref:Sugar ABC transporter substrate-binding protein n=1 Tax=Amycolatopsis deserti TaxID=185696 RepID=A0ABQ3JGG8_9PSEU|nr:sugar-binding protein [Amycolatopsis deserti]GHF17074.1 sugar ABC transporter substrate-binding protein [Amycolatopsis deserti]